MGANPLALTLKLADISHNADPKRQEGLAPEMRERLTAKYEEPARLLGVTVEGIVVSDV